MSRSGIVNVRMVITEEKMLSNIDKVQKLINPKSKKQIVQLEEDAFFKDLIDSVKTYLIEYPKKKNFPRDVYKAAYDLVEYATNQFEENTKKVEDLIRQREKNIKPIKLIIEIIIVGGTGLYIDSLIYEIEYKDIKINEEYRKKEDMEIQNVSMPSMVLEPDMILLVSGENQSIQAYSEQKSMEEKSKKDGKIFKHLLRRK